MLTRPEVFPIPTVRRGEEVILDEDSDEEPDDDLSADDGAVEGWDAAGRLAVVVREAKEKNDANGPHEERDGDGDACKRGSVGDKSRGLYTVESECIEARAPEPEQDNIDLLCALDGAGAETPGCDRDATFAAEVEAEVEGAT